jgi:hypothetical protein
MMESTTTSSAVLALHALTGLGLKSPLLVVERPRLAHTSHLLLRLRTARRVIIAVGISSNYLAIFRISTVVSVLEMLHSGASSERSSSN